MFLCCTILYSSLSTIEPGGYLQWSDFDFGDQGLYELSPDPVLKSLGDSVLDGMKQQQYSVRIFDDIRNKLRTLPVDRVQILDYTGKSYHDDDINQMVLEWHKTGIEAVLRPMYKRGGNNMSEAELKEKIRDYNSRYDRVLRDGYRFHMALMTLVARRM